jgi:NAD(P)-dependent dehydrogenase (short-subunit alcohol dehydrogenase family)
MIDLQDKVVVITGASSGIGKATAVSFAQTGAHLVLVARRQEKLKDVESYIASFKTQCISVKADVTREEEVQNLFAQVERVFGRVDILINNAGRGLEAELCDISYDEWLSVINTNLTSVFLCTREAVKHMITKGIQGHIITVSSTSGLFGVPTYAAYCASKHGVTGFKRSIRWDLRKHKIKVSTIHPANVDTEFFTTLKTTPQRRDMLTARDIADHLVAIASRSTPKIIAVRLLLIFKRIYYVIKYAVK